MWIEEYRSSFDLTREALGKLAGCSGQLIYILERGGITHPRIADRIASICNVGRDERNSIVDGAHWRQGWRQIPKCRAKGEKAEKAYFLRLARKKIEAEKRQSISQANGGQLSPEGQPNSQAEGKQNQTEVCAINRLGQIIGRYPDCEAAAKPYAVKRITVLRRCEHKIGAHTDEYLGGVTFRYAAEWDRLSDAEREKRAAGARQRRPNRDNSRISLQSKYSWQGQTHDITEWARIANIHRQTLQSRLTAGWDIGKALTTPIKGSYVPEQDGD